MSALFELSDFRVRIGTRLGPAEIVNGVDWGVDRGETLAIVGESGSGKSMSLLSATGLERVTVSPRMVYVDDSRPELVEGFTRNTFTAMVEGVRDRALAEGLIDPATWERGIADLYRTAEGGGTFCYTFFKGVGYRPGG